MTEGEQECKKARKKESGEARDILYSEKYTINSDKKKKVGEMGGGKERMRFGL